MMFLQQHQHVAVQQKSQYSMLVIFYIVFILLFLFPLGGRAAENQPPSATSISVSTKEDATKSIKLTGTDPERKKLTYAIVSQPAHGTVVLKGASARYTPTANYFSLPGSPDSFTFKVNDGLVDSAPATVSVTVSAVNDKPVAQGGSVSAVKNTARDIPLLGADVDLDTLTYVPAKKSKKGGVVSLKDNNIVTYTPKKDYVGTDSFKFTVKDNKKGVSKAATINIAVNGSNAAPTANAGTAQTVEGGAAVTLNGGGQDQDGNVTLYAWSQVSGTPVVSLTGGNTSTASFIAPNVDVDTPLTFRLTVTDNNGATATSDVVVTIKKAVGNIQLQGSAVTPPVVGGTVTAKNLSGSTFATATTDADGKFVFSATHNNLKDGYSVSITGGTMDGAPFTGTLNATYASTDAKDAVNLTAVTSLVESIAADMPGATQLEKRNAAIQKLARFGLIGADNWNQLTSEYFDLQALALRIQDAGGLQAWLDLIKADLADGELSVAESRSLFPKAHGGVESASVQSEMSVFPGESAKTTVLTNVESVAVTLRTAPSWVRVDGKDIIAEPPLGENAGLHSVTLEVSANNVAQGRKIAFDVSVLKQTTLAHGFLDQNGGVIENEWRDIAVSAVAGALSQSYEVSYVAGLDQAGDVTLKLVTNPPAVSEDVDDFSIVAPSFEIIKENYLKESGIAPTARSASVSASAAANASSADVCGNSYPDLNGDGFAYSYEWFGKKAMFNNLLGANTLFQSNGGSLPRLLPNANNGYLDFPVSRCASRLVSRHPLNTSLLGEPVLFIHGFINDGSLGGGDDYFVNFPRLIEQLNLNGSTFIPFNFQWRTNARFEDVANELGAAIKLINDKTGKKVHIVAHSYGGLLTRTLLQGHAEYFDTNQNKMLRNPEYTKSFMEKRIATVTTVGTPHSGVFGGKTTVEFDGESEIFYDGRDDGYGTTIGLCGALTCHEAGENWYTLRNKVRNYGIDEKEGKVVFRLANSFATTYPNIPTQQLIGIVPDSVFCDASSAIGECKLSYGIEADTGDGLISLHGQRFLPELFSEGLYSINNGLLNVSEHLLGFDSSSFINQDNVLVDLYAQMKEDGYFSDGSFNVTTLKRSSNKYQAVAYHHMGGQGNPNQTVSKREDYGTMSVTRSWLNPLLTEVGLQNCTSPNDCNHATWNYVVKMLSENPAGTFMPYVDKVKVNGNIGYSQAQSSESLEGFTVKVFIDGDWLGTATTDVNGAFDLDVDFYPNRMYVLEVYSPASMDTTTAPRAVVVTKMSAATPEETDMSFSRIELTSRTFQQGDLVVQVKDGTTGASLLGYNLTIGTFTRKLVDNKIVNAVEDATVTLPHGLYTVHITKDGYVGEGKATCMIRQLQNNACVVTMIPDGYVVGSGLSAVLTWDANPNDLDSHLLKYDTSGNLLCHTYYGNMGACGNEGRLDLDDTTSYGPETTAMQQVDANSNYVYAIHHFAGNGSITSTSQAKVTVTLANGTSQTFNAPTSGTGRYWKVFEIRGGRLLPCQSGCITDSLSAPAAAMSADLPNQPVNMRWNSDIEGAIVPKQ